MLSEEAAAVIREILDRQHPLLPSRRRKLRRAYESLALLLDRARRDKGHVDAIEESLASISDRYPPPY